MALMRKTEDDRPRGPDVAAWIRKTLFGSANRIFISVGVGLIALLGIAMNAISLFADPPITSTYVDLPPSPQEVRRQQVQAAVNQGEALLLAHIKSNIHDPGSFELVDDHYVDGGDHITMVMTYRGRNGFNALRMERVGATFDLQGNIISVQEIE